MIDQATIEARDVNTTSCRCGRTLKATRAMMEQRLRCPHCRSIRDPRRATPIPHANTDRRRTSDRVTSSTTVSSQSGSSIAPMAYAAMFSAVPVLLFPFSFPFPLCFGLLALRDIQRNPHHVGKGRAIFGICWGVIGFVICIAVTIVMLLFSGR